MIMKLAEMCGKHFFKKINQGYTIGWRKKESVAK